MKRLTFNHDGIKNFVQADELKLIQPLVQTAHQLLINGTGMDAKMSQWLTLPQQTTCKQLKAIQDAAQEIRKTADVLVVIGIGGSYLGAKMALDFLHGSLYNFKARPQIVFAGNTLSPTYTNDILDLIGDSDFAINVISKSGTTTEPAIAFRIFKQKLIAKYGSTAANQRIYVTTDAHHGALHQEAQEHGYHMFTIPAGIGGRYSVLTPVGLLPIAVSGIPLTEIMAGAQDAVADLYYTNLSDNAALQYAAYRNILYRKGITNEILETYEPQLRFLTEWWKQLAGETEGKHRKGIYPSSAVFSTDLHSLGQYIQDGLRNIMETVVEIKHPQTDCKIPVADDNLDELHYLENQSLDYVNKTARQAVSLAHINGDVPNMLIQIPDNSATTLGYLIYFFEFAIATSGYLNGINPFNQPGVEDYKQNMFTMLGKTGFNSSHKSH
jgi:glucose-6-phosphate isomerase